MPTPRVEVAFATLDGKLYVLGGLAESSQESRVGEAYDVRSNTWQSIAPMPEARDHLTAAAFEGKLYAFGGSLGLTGEPTNTAFVYDPATNTWERLPDLPLRRRSGGAAVIESKIILVGGTGDSPLTTLVYDPAARSWSTGPQLPIPLDHEAVASVNGRVYALGGRWEYVELPVNYYIESLAGPWKQATPIRTMRGGTVGATLNGRIYVAGGEVFSNGPMHAISEVEEYDPASDTWRLAGYMSIKRHALAIGAADGKLIMTAGGPQPGLTFTNLTDIYQPR
jgi:N-acetylneuraminic acid mutarotase